MKKPKQEKIYNSLLVTIFLVTIISFEWVNPDIMLHKSANSDVFSLRCFARSKRHVNINATMVKIHNSIYQITLTFDDAMKNSSSFLSPYNVIDTFWDNLFEFNIVVNVGAVGNNQLITINPDKYEDVFITECGQSLPMQTIPVKKVRKQKI